MENLTPIELNNLVNKTKEEHEKLKSEIINLLDDVKEIEENINKKIKILSDLEEKYVKMMSILMEKN